MRLAQKFISNFDCKIDYFGSTLCFIGSRKTVRERTKDTFGLWRKGELNPESNVQFGEGGAGTFSDRCEG